MNFLSNFIKSFSHDAEILLRCKRSAKSLCCCSVRNIIQKTLSGSSDNCNNICALSCTGLSLNAILVDITCRDNDIYVRSVGILSVLLNIFLSSKSAVSYFLDSCIYHRLNCFHQNFPVRNLCLFCNIKSSLCNFFRYLLWLQSCTNHCISNEEQSALTKHSLVFELIYNSIWNWNHILIYAVNSKRAADSSLCSYSCIVLHKRLHVSGYVFGKPLSLCNLVKI